MIYKQSVLHSILSAIYDYTHYILKPKLIPVLIIDNYDSFTYNLVHYFEALNAEVSVIRNDAITIEVLNKFDKIVISPGSGLPKEAGQVNTFIKQFAPSKSILGICLGQQAIAEVFGGKLKILPKAQHGVASQVTHLSNDAVLYKGIPKTFRAGLYYSWETTELPKELEVTSLTSDGIIMSIKHKKHDLRAVQYHPESILTPFGKNILENWLNN